MRGGLGSRDEKYQELFSNMSAQEKEERSVFAVATGCTVQCANSSGQVGNISLDFNTSGYHGWCSPENKVGMWVQVSCEQPRYWTEVIIQGRGDADQWVTSFKVSTTVSGNIWENVDEGKVFPGNNDRNQKVRVRFAQPVYARTVRIYPQTWVGHMSMRFDAVYLDLQNTLEGEPLMDNKLKVRKMPRTEDKATKEFIKKMSGQEK